MTAWSILTGNSTAPAGSSAWQHLNSQGAGTGGTGTIIIGGITSVELQNEDLISTIEQPLLLEADMTTSDTQLTSNYEEGLDAFTDTENGVDYGC